MTLYSKRNDEGLALLLCCRGNNCAVGEVVVRWVRKSLVNSVVNLFCGLKHLSPLNCVDSCFSHQIKLICRALDANDDGPKTVFINLSGNLKIWI